MQTLQMVLGERLPRAAVSTSECVAGCEGVVRVRERVSAEAVQQ